MILNPRSNQNGRGRASAHIRAACLAGSLGLSLMLGACAGTRTIGGASDLVVLPDQELPPPLAGDYARSAEQHLLGPFDKVIIDVQAFEELRAREIQIDASGRFALPWIGAVDAAGLSIAELENVLVERLRAAHLRNPQVAINLGEANSRMFTVEGQVKNPGLHPVRGRMTLMQGVAMAGGTTDFANSELVIIFRDVGNQRMAAVYDINRVRLGMDRDPEIYPNDIIMIDDNKARRLFGQIIQAAFPLSQFILIVDRIAR
jgi:polysaccharide export outer membrane protein